MSKFAFLKVAPKIVVMNFISRKPVLLMAAVFSMVTTVAKAEVPEPPPKDGAGQRNAGPMGGMLPGVPGMYPRGDRDRMDAFKQLTEDERQRVRAAFEKAWSNTEVVKAREALSKANEDYRAVLHRVLRETDPGIAEILEKMKSQTPAPGGFPIFGQMPDPKDPEFAKKVISRLREDNPAGPGGEKREPRTGHLRERVMNSPAVKDLIGQLEAAKEPQEKIQVYNRLREAWMTAMRAEFGQMREGRQRRDSSAGDRPGRKDDPATVE